MAETKTALDIEGFHIILTRKRIRHFYIRVAMADGSVHVSAPLRMSLKEIKAHIRERRDWILLQQKRAAETPSAMTDALPPEAGDILKKRLAPMIPRCEALTGQSAAGYRLKDMRTRWGSCSMKTRRISLNLRLYSKDDDCLRYVLIHELCHFYEPNHSPAFYHYMDKFYPEWRAARKKLRVNGDGSF